MLKNLLLHKFKLSLKISLAARLISSLLFISLHPSLAYAQTPVMQTPVVVVAVIDEGVYSKHPEFKNSMWVNSKEISGNNFDDDNNGFTDDIEGWNFLDSNNNLSPKGGHGTKLSGLIAGSAQIMPLIACSETLGCSQQAIINAIYYAVDNGASVINLSLGDTSGYKTAYNDAVTYAFERNVVIVASSGSASVGHSLSLEPMSPICNDNGKNMVLGVGTIDDKCNRPAWANYGGCIDVTAKGTNVYTTFNPDFSGGKLYGTIEGNSFATAFVSGEVAKLMAYDNTLSAADVISRIHKNASGKNLIINLDAAKKNLAARPKVLGASISTKPIVSKKVTLTIR